MTMDYVSSEIGNNIMQAHLPPLPWPPCGRPRTW